MPNAKDTDEIVVAGTGSIFIATYGAALPSSYDSTLPSAYIELGYTDEDGVTFRDEPTIEKRRAWQSFYPVRILETERMAEVSFNLLQWNTKAFEVAAGGGTAASAGTGKQFTPKAAGTVSEWTVVIAASDGTRDYRIVIPRCMTTSALETQLSRTDMSRLPATLEAIGVDGAAPWTLYSDDTAAFA